MESVETLAEQVMQLPMGQRLTIAHRILASMDEADDSDVRREWEEEIRARIERYDKEPESALDGAAVLSELEKKLGE